MSLENRGITAERIFPICPARTEPQRPQRGPYALSTVSGHPRFFLWRPPIIGLPQNFPRWELKGTGAVSTSPYSRSFKAIDIGASIVG